MKLTLFATAALLTLVPAMGVQWCKDVAVGNIPTCTQQGSPFQGDWGGVIPGSGGLRECSRINICHAESSLNGNGGNPNDGPNDGWNQITVNRNGLEGHCELSHSKTHNGQEVWDVFPGGTQVPNMRGAGYGSLDSQCIFTCDTASSDCCFNGVGKGCTVTPAPTTAAPVTSAPTTAAPVTSAPTTAAPVTPAPTPPPVCEGSACADPHFKLWNGEYYDYHGGCDLVLVHAPDFAEGLGLDIHIRTTIRYDYSFIGGAAVKIGDDVFEVSSWGVYSINGVDSASLPNFVGPFTVEHEKANEKKHVFKLHFGGEESLEVSTFKDWVNVKVVSARDDQWGSSQGMMGQFRTGIMFGRDGETVIEDVNQFGQEWQVLPTDPTIFSTERFPQASKGEKCMLPAADAVSTHRRLGATIAQEAAEEACSHYDDAKHIEMCVYDVMASGDLDMAHAGAF